MSNFGQVSLALVGASIGWVFSGGNPLGAAWGFSIGMSLGSAAFPTDLGTIKGPRLNDTQTQTSAIGAPIPIVYGQYALAGNLIWSSAIKETVKKKKRGGKGGPKQKVKTFSYSCSIAIGVCEGRIGQYIRIWADAKVIYDNRPQGVDETEAAYTARVQANADLLASMTFYLGTEDQLPDPTIESFEGIGNVSAFRGLAYVVFSDFQLGEYGNRIPNFRFEVNTVGEGDDAVTIGSIIEDVCARCGLSGGQVSVTDLKDEPLYLVDGYVVGRPASGRDMINPLLGHTKFDCVESSGTLRWQPRLYGGSITIDEESLAAHGAGNQRPSIVEVQRQQEVELPRTVRLHYAQVAQNYEPGEQTASRITARSQLIADIEVPIAMTDQKAAQAAEVTLYDAWVSRNKYRISLGAEYLRIEPTDLLRIPIDGRLQLVRVVAVNNSLPTLVTLDCVAEDQSAYSSYALGSETAYVGAAEADMDTPGTPVSVALDIPVSRSADEDAGYYFAVNAQDSTFFGGADILRSADGGATFDEAASTELSSTMGLLDADVPSGPTTIFDEANEIIVTLYGEDELESLTEASVLTGKNAAAIGADGRWEIVQFRDAVLVESSPQTNTWRLTGLLRGRRGTEWAVGTALAGDWFVLLDEGVVRLPWATSQLGAEAQHKVVLVGMTLESAVAEAFTPEAVNLRPFSPVGLAVTDDAGDLVIEWVRRSRAGTELVPGDIPLWEETEAYEVDILDAADPLTVVRTISAATPTATYTAADQATDFGGPTPDLIIRVYQMSATVGRGYPLEGLYP